MKQAASVYLDFAVELGHAARRGLFELKKLGLLLELLLHVRYLTLQLLQPLSTLLTQPG